MSGPNENKKVSSVSRPLFCAFRLHNIYIIQYFHFWFPYLLHSTTSVNQINLQHFLKQVLFVFPLSAPVSSYTDRDMEIVLIVSLKVCM